MNLPMQRKRVIVSDIDGVLADSSARLREHLSQQRRMVDHNTWLKSWWPYNTSPKILEDIPIHRGIELFHALMVGFRADEFRFITARGSEGIDLTRRWLIEHVIGEDFPEEWLIMQPQLEEIAPGIVWRPGMPKYDPVDQKRVQISSLMSEHDVLVAIDDRPDICQAYWHLGVHAMLVRFPEHDCQALVKEDVTMRAL